MSMLDWARKEVELRVKFENKDVIDDDSSFDYGGACAHSALRAFEILCEDGHSGMSIGITKAFLNRLIDGLPLTKIEDIPENWTLIEDSEERKSYQCNRCSSLFKNVKGNEVKYTDVQRHYCIDINNGSTYSSGSTNDIINELYPITMPYWPLSERIKIYTEDFLVDPKFGDYDTKAYLYLIHPEHGRVELNRYYQETDNGWVKIDENSYNARKGLARRLTNNTQEEETTNEQ